jgi:hypothetical protein
MHTNIQVILLEKKSNWVLSNKVLKCILGKKSYIHLTIICIMANTVKEMRILHIKAYASQKVLENVFHATGFY